MIATKCIEVDYFDAYNYAFGFGQAKHIIFNSLTEQNPENCKLRGAQTEKIFYFGATTFLFIFAYFVITILFLQ